MFAKQPHEGISQAICETPHEGINQAANCIEKPTVDNLSFNSQFRTLFLLPIF